MKEEILQKLGAVLGALNNVTVSGRANLNNLSGSMTILEGIVEQLSHCEVTIIEPAEN